VNRQTRKVVSFILKVVSDKNHFFFWLFVRFVSATLPLVTIYQFSHVVKLVENQTPVNLVLWAVFLIFVIRIIDNFLRLRSISKLEKAISDISFNIHNFFLSDLKTETTEERHAIVQAIRNFADASSVTLNLIKQPGIDSLVSLIFVPSILFFLDFQIFIITVVSILIYYFIDHYTTQRYAQLKDIQNTKTEAYYAKLVEDNDFELEQATYSRHFKRLTHWSFIEWFSLQNTAVLFYSLSLFSLIHLISQGNRDISNLVLVMGYVSQVQVFLNSFSQIQDSLADMFVGLEHLAKNQSVAAIDLDDLI